MTELDLFSGQYLPRIDAMDLDQRSQLLGSITEYMKRNVISKSCPYLVNGYKLWLMRQHVLAREEPSPQDRQKMAEAHNRNYPVPVPASRFIQEWEASEQGKNGFLLWFNEHTVPGDICREMLCLLRTLRVLEPYDSWEGMFGSDVLF